MKRGFLSVQVLVHDLLRGAEAGRSNPAVAQLVVDNRFRPGFKQVVMSASKFRFLTSLPVYCAGLPGRWPTEAVALVGATATPRDIMTNLPRS